MNKRFYLLSWAWAWVCGALGAQPLEPALQLSATRSTPTAATLSVQTLHLHNAGARPTELVCTRKGPVPRRPDSAPAEPTEIPDDSDVAQALAEALTDMDARSEPAPRTGAVRLQKTANLRVAIWGDSHMAAAFFSDQLMRQITGPAGPNQDTLSQRFVHAGVGHGGVRGLVRKTCLSGEWGREMAYAHSGAAAAPGPGMTSLVAKRSGATLALDLRDAQGQPRHTRLQILHHGEASGTTRLAISVDGQAESELSLSPQAGPHAVALSTDVPLSTLQIRVLEGAFRFQGLKLAEPASPTALHLDLFAYPGATVAGWVRSDLPSLATWFTDQTYDLSLIAFGTNEGNDPRFSETAYRDTLNKALGNFRQVFPQTQCVLIGPGDRGIRVVKSKTTKKTKAKKGSKKPAIDLLKFSRIHAQIAQIQSELAAQHGCLSWRMQEAMGGVGSAYAWARKSPPLMAPDLIHFTPAGYRELAKRFMADMDLTAP
jgi:hypothetical protein